MKKKILFLFLILNLIYQPTTFANSKNTQKHVFLRVVSINMNQIRKKCPKKLNILANEIANLKMKPDIIAFQELGARSGHGYDVLDFIRILNKKTSAKYATGPLAIEVNTSSELESNKIDSRKKKGGIGIIYNKLTTTELQKSTFNLPNGNDRKAVKGLYAKKGFLFQIGNTHYPRETELERVHPFTPWRANNRALISFMNDGSIRKTPDNIGEYPQILAGDFNIDRKDTVFSYNLQKNALNWSSFGTIALDTIASVYQDSLSTINTQKPAHTYKRRRVDYIWSKNFKIINAGVNLNNNGKDRYSDHNFIWSTLTNLRS